MFKMKTIILVRHAKSSWKDPGLDDFDRPLNKRGKRNAPFMGGKLKKRDILPDLVLSSPAKRAKKTAIAVAKALGYPKKEIKESLEISLWVETAVTTLRRESWRSLN